MFEGTTFYSNMQTLSRFFDIFVDQQPLPPTLYTLHPTPLHPPTQQKSLPLGGDLGEAFTLYTGSSTAYPYFPHKKRRSPALIYFVWVASDVSLYQPKQNIPLELS